MAAGPPAELRAAGRPRRVRPLGTSIPPQSPVAWSTFITGLDPGGHGIFDFVHRDPKTMTPYLSTTRTEPPSHFVSLGRWQLPLTARTGGAAPKGPAVLGGARAARHRHDDRAHAGQLPALRDRHAGAERDGHARPARHLRDVLVLHVGCRSPAGGAVAGGTVYPVDGPMTASCAARSKGRTTRC